MDKTINLKTKKLTSALKNAGVSQENCEVFINLIYDETEENQEEISKEWISSPNSPTFK